MASELTDLQPTHFATLDPLLLRSVVATAHCPFSTHPEAENLRHIGDLVRNSKTDLLRTPKLGRKALKEINEALASRGLALGSH